MAFEQIKEFLLKRFSLVMFFLVGEVGRDMVDLRIAHRECAVSVLPLEVAQ